MIRMVQSQSATDAKKYFTEGLMKPDYYIQDQELQGHIWGKLADRLNLTGAATKEVFFSLCDNKNPHTGKRLTKANKENRVAGYDISFSAPKSVSILMALSERGDDQVIKAFEECVRETLTDIESDAQTRIRKDKVYEDRSTGELIIAGFTHLTARPTKGNVADMHLHHHAFVLNATYDPVEDEIKAAKFRHIMKNLPYYDGLFMKRLADKMVSMGYDIMQEGKSFELVGVKKELIKLFSKRTQEIEKKAKEQGITDAKKRDGLGAKTRGKKDKGMSMDQLKADWLRQIRELRGSSEIDTKPIRQGIRNDKILTPAEEIISQTILHCFERASVLNERKLLAEACRFAMGHRHISIDQLAVAIRNDLRIIRITDNKQTLCTTKEVLAEEREMVELARQGLGKVKPFYMDVPLERGDQQQAAINHVLTTRNRISIVRGAAGSGKTFLMRKAISKIEETGKKVKVVAPTAAAARGVLKDEGYKDAETVAKLLSDKDLQDELKNAVLWVDEAGLLGTKDMVELLKITKAKNARLILGGDTLQHSAVIRGDALRILNTVGGIPAAEVNVIRRQQKEIYKSAVEDLAKGDVAAGFEKLDGMGAIQTMPQDNPNGAIVDRYIDAIKSKRSVLVISPTHAQGENITADIRKELRKEGKLGKKEVTATRYINRNMTMAEKADARSYEKGHAVQFNLPAKGFKRGSFWLVEKTDDAEVQLVNKEGQRNILPLKTVERFDVFNIASIALSKGDKVRITRNSYEQPKAKPSPKTVKKGDKIKDAAILPKRMDNGLSLEFVSMAKGKIKLKNPISKAEYIVDQEFGHLAHEYCLTSQSSQGKTTDEVLIVQPSSTFGATNAKQFYVSVSRGRHLVSVFTDDRKALLEHVQELGNRQSAMELIKGTEIETDYVFQKQRRDKSHGLGNAPNHDNSHHKKERGYEPSL